MKTIKQRLGRVAFAAGLATGGLATGAWGDTYSTRVGRGADAHVARTRPAENFGGDGAIRIKNATTHVTGDFDRKSYFRFDILPLAGRIVDRVVLELSVVAEPNEGAPAAGPQVFRVYGITDGTAGDASPDAGGWTEGSGTDAAATTEGITWASAPANDDSAEGAGPDATLLGTFTLDGIGVSGAIASFTSEALGDLVEADTNQIVTLIVTRETQEPAFGGWVHRFASKEALQGAAPALRVLTACPLLGDLDCNCMVDLGDLATLLSNFGQFGDAVPGDGDLNSDGNVDLSDLAVMLVRFALNCE